MKSYKCICGQEFDNPAKFNGHKQGCKIHLTQKYGSYEAYLEIKNRNQNTAKINQRKYFDDLKEKKENKWISEKHTCEKCGKIMTEKYGSGRFCSKFCACSRSHSEDSKLKVSRKLKDKYDSGQLKAVYHPPKTSEKHFYTKDIYHLNPTKCIVCNSPLPYEQRMRKTCSVECKKQLLSIHTKENGFGGPNKVSSYGKHGTYKGIHCDSTYELVFLIYCLDHNIKIIRNEKSFPYEYNNEIRNYYPDFFLPDYNLYIETKGRDIGPVYEKLEGMKLLNENIKLLHYEDLIPCFEYVKNTYKVYYSRNKSNLEILYDEDN